MGQSPDAKIGWGIDLGSEEGWDDGKLAPLGRRFLSGDDQEHGGSFNDWSEETLPALYINKAERDAKLDALFAAFESDRATGEQRAQYHAEREAIRAQYPVPVAVETYGYEYGSCALLLTRSLTCASDWTAVAVDPATLTPPTDDELAALRLAVESLGLAWDPADVVLLLMPHYG